MSQTLVMDNSRMALRQFVAGLNRLNRNLSAEDHAALVRFVEAWNKAGRNLYKMKLLREDAERFSLPKLEKVFRLQLSPVGRRDQAKARSKEAEADGASWWISSTGENCRDLAAFYVSMLLTNPLRDKLCDEPCQRTLCGKWFIKRRESQKCCSRHCTVIVKAAIRTSRLRGEKQVQDIEEAQKAIREWKPSDGDWKKFVSKRTGLTVKWVSRNTANKKYPHRELRQPSRTKI